MSTEKANSFDSSNYSAPTHIRCLSCRTQQPVSEVKLENTSFLSKKQGKPMSRATWVAKCGGCGKGVRSFAKRSALAEENTDEKI